MVVGHERQRIDGGVDAGLGAAAVGRTVGRVQECRHQIGGALPHDAAHIESVAHLAVERVRDDAGEPLGVGVGRGDHPGTARSVEADRHPGLAGHRSELGHRRPRAAGDRE